MKNKFSNANDEDIKELKDTIYNLLQRNCPPDYNPGFCYDDYNCVACWNGWLKETYNV